MHRLQTCLVVVALLLVHSSATPSTLSDSANPIVNDTTSISLPSTATPATLPVAESEAQSPSKTIQNIDAEVTTSFLPAINVCVYEHNCPTSGSVGANSILENGVLLGAVFWMWVSVVGAVVMG